MQTLIIYKQSPLNNHEMVKPFVILASQRSGSTFVRIWLNQHSQINSYGEVFLGHYRSSDGFRAYCERRMTSKLLFSLHHSRICKSAHIEVIPSGLIEGYLETLYSSMDHPTPWLDINNRDTTLVREKKPLIGLKLMWNTLAQYSYLETWLVKHRPHIIHITRNNLLASFVSQLRMKESKIAHSTDVLDNFKPVHVNVDKFIRYVKELRGMQARYRDTFMKSSPLLEISYENIFSDLDQAKRKMLGFLEVENEEMSLPVIKKISSVHIRENVENYDEIEAHLTGTEYQSCIVDS